MKDVGEKRNMPSLELKHLIWVLGWAREHCADSIGRAELDRARHLANNTNPACTQYGYKDRATELLRLDAMIAEHRRVYAWLDGAKAQAMDKDAEEFGRAMAEMFGRKK